MNVKGVKRKIGIIINKTAIRPVLEIMNLFLFHWQDRMHQEHPGEEEQTILVIRPQTNTQGLLSSYLYVLKYVRWAEENNIPAYVDFESKNCQYYTGREIFGSRNAWEYYFEQTSAIRRTDIKRARTVLYSGWTVSSEKEPIPIPKLPDSGDDQEIIRIAHQKCGIKPYIKQIVDTKYKELFSQSVIGVFLRGTDYVRMKPKGHPIQPSIGQVIYKIDEFLDRHKDIDKIFVVTEDDAYFQLLKEKYGDMVFCSDDCFVKDYKGDRYVSEAFSDDAYNRGLNYLVRILLFGKCNYVIAGITNGSVVANILKEKKPKESYWFDLGRY